MSDPIDTTTISAEEATPVVVAIEPAPADASSAEIPAAALSDTPPAKKPYAGKKPGVKYVSPGAVAYGIQQEVVAKVFDEMNALKRSREMAAGLYAERKAIRLNRVNDETEKAALYEWAAKFTRAALKEAMGRLEFAEKLWAEKPNEWKHKYGTKAAEFGARHSELEPKFGVANKDPKVRGAMIALAVEVFAFTKDSAIRQPYGVCARCQRKAVRKNQTHCPDCFKAIKSEKSTSGNLDDATLEALESHAFAGVTVTLKSGKEIRGGKHNPDLDDVVEEELVSPKKSRPLVNREDLEDEAEVGKTQPIGKGRGKSKKK